MDPSSTGPQNADGMPSKKDLFRALQLAGQTFLSNLGEVSLQPLFSGALFVDLPANTVIYRPGDRSQMLIVESGMGRMVMESSDGRRMVVRHFGAGEVIGLVACLGGPVDLTVETIQPVTALLVTAETVNRCASQDPSMALEFARQCALRVYGVMEELRSMAFDDVYRRLIRHLLKVSGNPDRSTLARITQQELADSIATSREVVARQLKKLRDAGWVANQPDSPGIIEIKNPEKLKKELRKEQ